MCKLTEVASHHSLKDSLLPRDQILFGSFLPLQDYLHHWTRPHFVWPRKVDYVIEIKIQNHFCPRAAPEKKASMAGNPSYPGEVPDQQSNLTQMVILKRQDHSYKK